MMCMFIPRPPLPVAPTHLCTAPKPGNDNNNNNNKPLITFNNNKGMFKPVIRQCVCDVMCDSM